MRRITILAFFSLIFFTAHSQDTKEMHETAKTFMRQSDYANAVLVLNRAMQYAPHDLSLFKDLALCYYMQNDNAKALAVIKPILENDGADDQCYQIAGNIYKGLDMYKDCEKLYKKGIKRFPSSGSLYNELGELLWYQKNYNAIKYWEEGIEKDPAYSKNYFNASRYYFLTTDKVWSIVYGEIFVNMEPLSTKTAEIKDILLEGYKKLFSETNISTSSKEKSSFVKRFLECMNKQSSLATNGINIESLVMIRTRFILDWANEFKEKMPFKLFEYQQQLLQEGTFEAYNQWLFGAAQNLVNFQHWTQLHNQEYNEFIKSQQARLFKMPPGQYYR